VWSLETYSGVSRQRLGRTLQVSYYSLKGRLVGRFNKKGQRGHFERFLWFCLGPLFRGVGIAGEVCEKVDALSAFPAVFKKGFY